MTGKNKWGDRILAWFGFARLKVVEFDLRTGRERTHWKLVRVGRDWNQCLNEG